MTGADDGTVVGRAILVLEAVAAGRCVSLARLTEVTGLPKASARRIADGLVDRDMLERCEGGYALGRRLARLGAAARVRLSDPPTAGPHLRQLAARSGEVAFWCSVEDDHLVTQGLAVGERERLAVAGRGGWPPTMVIDARSAIMAAGRVVLAERPDLLDGVLSSGVRRLTPYSPPTGAALSRSLDRVRGEGVAVEVEEHTQGWCCAAAALRRPDESLVGVLGVCGRLGVVRHDRIGRMVAGAARELAASLPAVAARSRAIHRSAGA